MKYTIAICDNNKTYLDKYFSLVDEYIYLHKIDARIVTFDESSKCINAFSNVNFDILIIDIYLNNLNGIETSKKINKLSPNTKIIYTTKYDTYPPEVYESKHIYTIPSTKIDEILPIALNKAFNLIKTKNNILIPLTHKNKTILVNIKKIIYIEKELRKSNFVCTDNQYDSYWSTQEIIDKLPSNIFIQCHRSYFVNIAYINYIANNEITLKNGTVIPIGRKFTKYIKDKTSNIVSL